MPRDFIQIVLIALAIGCEKTSSPPATVATDVEPAKVEAALPMHTPVSVFINNRPFGESNGCTSTFVPQPLRNDAESQYGLKCGHPGAVSRLTWELVRTGENGDHYSFRRAFPYKGSNQGITTKDIVYDGTEQLLFEDEYQRITIHPAAFQE